MHRAFLLLSLLVPAIAFSQIQELENPGTVSAVQERAYRMQHELDLAVGVLPLDAFYKGLYAQVSYVFHFTDAFAWQVGRGGYVYSSRTGLREQLERDFGVLPTQFDEVQYFVGSDLMYSPLYGKFSVLNRWVVHTEFFLIGGATVFKFTNGFRAGVNLGGGLRVFATKNISFRLDVTNNFVLPSGNSGITNVMAVSLNLAINFGATE